MQTAQLSERRAADRKKMAAIIEGIARDCGATTSREEALPPGELWVKVEAAQGLRVTVELDANSPQPDVHVLAWHVHYDSNARLNPATFGDVNPYHFHKASHVAHGFEDLCQQLTQGLRLAASGEAFM